jgi:hypothetical protein
MFFARRRSGLGLFRCYSCGMADARRTFTDADRAAQLRLRALWNAKKKALKLTHERAAEEFGGVTPGLISNYLNGRAALGKMAVIKFARILKVPPEDIRSDISFGRQLHEDVPQDVIEIAWKIASLPERVRKDLARTVDLLLQASNYEAFLENAEKAKPL